MRTALLLLLAVAVAGCGAGAGRPASATTSAKHATVKTRHGALGTFLVDGRGRTLYRFMKDTGRKSHCSGACAANWPALTTREPPEAERGAKPALLSTRRRKDGTKQVLYAGHPLYRFVGDAAAGRTEGQGVQAFGGKWFVVARSGHAIRSTAAAAPAPTSSPYPY